MPFGENTSKRCFYNLWYIKTVFSGENIIFNKTITLQIKKNVNQQKKYQTLGDVCQYENSFFLINKTKTIIL